MDRLIHYVPKAPTWRRIAFSGFSVLPGKSQPDSSDNQLIPTRNLYYTTNSKKNEYANKFAHIRLVQTFSSYFLGNLRQRQTLKFY